MAIEERHFDSIESAAGTLAEDLAVSLRTAIADRGQASLILSGGRTPRPVLARLGALAVSWPEVTVSLSDERWVPADHPESNEALVRTVLMTGPAGSARFVPLYGGEDSPRAGQDACEARLAAIERPFDAVYLGMGGDGHFASLFPHEPALERQDGLCAAVPETPERQARMTLTAPAILSARRIFLLISGAEKRSVYQDAKRLGPVQELPIRLVLHQAETPVSVLIAP